MNNITVAQSIIMIFRVNYGSTQLFWKIIFLPSTNPTKWKEEFVMENRWKIIANVKKSTKLLMINCLIFVENEFIIFRDLYLDIYIFHRLSLFCFYNMPLYDSLTIHTLLAFVFIADFLSGFFSYFLVLLLFLLLLVGMLNEDIDFQKPVKFMGSIFVSLLESIEA